ncbi:unnamed protein product [Gongylonema pulchrum]|nr:unnamed protein product [Gongylonema pulchrum]
MATLSALRLLDVCVSMHAPLMGAVRATDSSLIVASLDSLFLTALMGNPAVTYVAVIACYLTQAELFPEHAYYAVSILRELSACRPSLQTRLVQAFSPLAVELIDSCARLTSVKVNPIDASPLDPPCYHGVSGLPLEKIRGETVRSFIEMCSSSLECDPSRANLAYFFCGFNMSDLKNSIIEDPGKALLGFNLWTKKQLF